MSTVEQIDEMNSQKEVVEEEEEEFEENLTPSEPEDTIADEEELKLQADQYAAQLGSYGRRYKKFVTEDASQEQWRNHKKHYFIITSSGRPVYTRYGDTSKLSGFLCIPQALVSFVDDMGDELQWIQAGKNIIAFLIQGPLIFVCVSKTGETITLLHKQLEYLYNQLLSILTYRAVEILNQQPNYDLISCLVGTDKFFDALIHRMSSFSFIVNGIPTLPLPPETRDSIGRHLRGFSGKGLKFAILMTEEVLIHANTNSKLSHSDLLLLINFASDSNFKSNAIWSPMCFPNHNKNSILHVYINYLDERICLVLVTSNMSSGEILHEQMVSMVSEFESNGVLKSLNESLEDYKNTTTITIGIPKAKHFIYKVRSTKVCYSPTVAFPFTLPGEEKKLLRVYQQVRNQLKTTQSKHYLITTDRVCVYGQISQDFELYVTLSPLSSKPEIVNSTNNLLAWLKKSENKLFQGVINNSKQGRI